MYCRGGEWFFSYLHGKQHTRKFTYLRLASCLWLDQLIIVPILVQLKTNTGSFPKSFCVVFSKPSVSRCSLTRPDPILYFTTMIFFFGNFQIICINSTFWFMLNVERILTMLFNHYASAIGFLEPNNFYYIITDFCVTYMECGEDLCSIFCNN